MDEGYCKREDIPLLPSGEWNADFLESPEKVLEPENNLQDASVESSELHGNSAGVFWTDNSTDYTPRDHLSSTPTCDMNQPPEYAKLTTWKSEEFSELSGSSQNSRVDSISSSFHESSITNLKLPFENESSAGIDDINSGVPPLPYSFMIPNTCHAESENAANKDKAMFDVILYKDGQIPVTYEVELSNSNGENAGKMTFDPEDIFRKCCSHCEIQPLHQNMFGLWSVKSNSWIYPGPPILHSSNNKLEFRLRFTFKSTVEASACRQRAEKEGTVKRFAVMDSVVLKYLFQQRRSAFMEQFPVMFPKDLENYFTKLLPNINQKDINLQEDLVLTAAVLEFFVQSKENRGTNSGKVIDIVSRLPMSSRKQLTKTGFWNYFNTFVFRCLLRKRFRQIVRSFADLVNTHSVEYYYHHYIAYVEDLEPRFNNEFFQLSKNAGVVRVNGDDGIVVAVDEAQLWSVFQQPPFSDPVDEGADGIGISIMDDKKAEVTEPRIVLLRLDFVDVLEISFVRGDNDSCTVHMSDIFGREMTLPFPDFTTAQQFASCVEGYYRLLVDPYDSLCPYISPTSFKRREKLVHGPVRYTFLTFFYRYQPIEH